MCARDKMFKVIKCSQLTLATLYSYKQENIQRKSFPNETNKHYNYVSGTIVLGKEARLKITIRLQIQEFISTFIDYFNIILASYSNMLHRGSIYSHYRLFVKIYRRINICRKICFMNETL